MNKFQLTYPLKDEVLVGTDHPTVLSVNAPKEVSHAYLTWNN